MLMLHNKHKAEDVKEAIEKALMVNVSCSSAVSQILFNSTDKEKIKFTPLENWQSLQPPDISVYGKIGGAI